MNPKYAPSAQMVLSLRLIIGRPLVQVQQGAPTKKTDFLYSFSNNFSNGKKRNVATPPRKTEWDIEGH